MSLMLDNVSVVHDGRSLLDGVSLTLTPGEMIAVIGPNGAGKTTLMRVAAGLLTPSSGRVTLDGLPLHRFSPASLAARRAMLTQDQSLDARFSVVELVRFGVQARGPSRVSLDALVARTLEEVGLAAFSERDITSLSGGERQRAHLARILVQLRWHGHEGYLLLDEPVSAQDIARQRQVLSLARAYTSKNGVFHDGKAAGNGCLAILHDLNWAAAFADRVVVLARGRIYDAGPPETVITPSMLRDVFGLTDVVPGCHRETGRPFLLPHDLVSPRSS